MAKQTKTYDSPLMQFAVDALRANKNVVYADLAAAAKAKGLTMVPVVFGRAKKVLGLAKKAKGGAAKKSAAKAAKAAKSAAAAPAAAAPAKKRGRPAKAAASASTSGAVDFGAVFSHVRGLEKEVADLRARLAKIAAVAGG